MLWTAVNRTPHREADRFNSNACPIAESHVTVRHESQDLRGERRDELKKVEALTRPSRSQPGQRVRTLESESSTRGKVLTRLGDVTMNRHEQIRVRIAHAHGCVRAS